MISLGLTICTGGRVVVADVVVVVADATHKQKYIKYPLSFSQPQSISLVVLVAVVVVVVVLTVELVPLPTK